MDVIDHERVLGCLEGSLSVVLISEDDPMKVETIEVSARVYDEFLRVVQKRNDNQEEENTEAA